MKKYIFYIIIIALLLITAIGLFIFKDKIFIKKEKSDFIYLEKYQNKLIDNEYQLLTSIEEHNKIFTVSELTKESFQENNYLLFGVPYDSCSEENLEPTSYSLTKNTLIINIDYTSKCGVCAPQYIYYFLKLAKNITFDNIDLKYHSKNDPKCNNFVAYKPIIYLYPSKTEKITIKIGYPDKLTTTYPKYENEWNVYAYPNGHLIDNKTGRNLYALYWEGNNHPSKVTNEGFVIKGEETITFLEEKLKMLGLNDYEADEFIIYWLPKMEHNKYNYIRFETMEEIDNYMPLSISPTPDTIIRIQMDFKPLNDKIMIKEQTIIPIERKGFTVVEWGGSIIK